MIDACCLIDLLASGEAEAILRSTGHAWHLPASVQAEIRFVRRHDPENPGTFKNMPADLTPLLNAGVLTPCQPDEPQEQTQYVHYATLFRSDGEAMCLALAECRNWIVATDDRKAIHVAEEAGLEVISCPELVNAWATVAKPDSKQLVHILTEIQTLAQFRPNALMAYCEWCNAKLARKAH